DGPAILARRGGDGLCRHTSRGVHYKRRAFGLVHWRSTIIRLRGLCHHALPVAAASAVTLYVIEQLNSCPLIALSGHPLLHRICPLWGKADIAIALRNVRF